MKGLLLKDFYQLIKYCKMFFLIDIVFFAVAFFSGENLMFICFPVMLSGLLPLTLLGYDERCGWSNYSGTLPYNEKQIVSAKYLIGLIVQTATVAVTAVVLLVKGFADHDQSFLVNMSAICVMFIASLIFPAFCLPLCYKFGTEKGRIFYYIIIAGVTTVGMQLYATLAENFEGTGADISNIILPLILVGIAILYIVSWIISVLLLKSAKR